MKLKSFLNYNKYFVTVCATWASVNDEFGVPENKTFKLIDNATVLWSFIIIITSWIKFKSFNQAEYERHSGIFQERSATLMDLFKLEYLPYVNVFAKLYYALVIVTVGVALIWRLYVRFWRPVIETQNEYSRIGFQTRKELVKFFLEGPVEPPRPTEEHIYEEIKERPYVRQAADSESNEPGFLSSMLRRRVVSRFDGSGRFKTDTSEAYTIPVRTDKSLLADCSTQDAFKRWLYLAKHVHAFYIVVSLISVVIVNQIYRGLRSVTINFGWEKSIETSPLADALRLYGYCEMTYAVCQGAIFSVFTNVFITLGYGSVAYIHGKVHGDLKLLCLLYLKNDGNPPEHNGGVVPLWLVRRLQLQTCAYFDHIYRLDSFVSKYGMVSIIAFVVCLLFSTSIMTVEDHALKTAAISVLIVNGISFAYIFVLSYLIEAKVSAIDI